MQDIQNDNMQDIQNDNEMSASPECMSKYMASIYGCQKFRVCTNSPFSLLSPPSSTKQQGKHSSFKRGLWLLNQPGKHLFYFSTSTLLCNPLNRHSLGSFNLFFPECRTYKMTMRWVRHLNACQNIWPLYMAFKNSEWVRIALFPFEPCHGPKSVL